jgi:hypothetical protein
MATKRDPQIELPLIFENLKLGSFVETSPLNTLYNCIAWVAGDTTRKWWPWAFPPAGYWPAGVVMEETIEAFTQAFETLGFTRCGDGSLEPGFEKAAIYARPDGSVQHMALQLVTGEWTSKLGDLEDISHDSLDRVGGKFYGTAVAFLRRARKP